MLGKEQWVETDNSKENLFCTEMLFSEGLSEELVFS